MRNSVIIIAIIVIAAVIIVGAFAAMNMFTTPATADNKTQITTNGSKITVINNNQDVWTHWKLQIQNAPHKNGTQQTHFVEVFIKPGENTTFDLSNLLDYGEETLPQDTNITVLAWGGVYNATASGNNNLNITKYGWTTNQTVPEPGTTYKTAIDPLDINSTQDIGALPENITDNTVNIGLGDFGSLPHDQLFVQFNIIIDPNGVPHFELREPPVLCEAIAQG